MSPGLGVDYVDIFYHHRPDLDTPLEETMGALASAVKQGKALYVGLSNYGAERTSRACELLRGMGTPCLVHQPRYNIFDRRVEEEGVLRAIADERIGTVVFSPLAQGVLAGRYLSGIPKDSRAATCSYKPDSVAGDDIQRRVLKLAKLAQERGQSLPQLALAWVLRQPAVTSAIIGASRPEQVVECARCLDAADFTAEELTRIDAICAS